MQLNAAYIPNENDLPPLIESLVKSMRYLATISILIMTSCVSTKNLQPWQINIPDIEYFRQAYAEDRNNNRLQTDVEYLNWVITFYKGTEYLPFSWNQIETQVLNEIENDQKVHTRELLLQLGILICQEWAKDNSVRKVNTAMLSMWGGVLQGAVDQNKIEQTIALIAQDVDGLLSSEIMPETLTLNRYQKLLGIGVFDEF